ncbi:unnamed protein product, partial [Ixodes hexagonus]
VTRSCDLATEFVVKIQTLYGGRSMTFNVHQILHLPKSVQMLGPLWAHSSFVFEGGNGALVKLVSDGNGVPLQILERYAMCLNAKLLRSVIDISEATESFCSQFSRKKDCGTHVPHCTLTASEKEAFVKAFGCVPNSLSEFERILIDGRLFHSQHYT